MKYTKHPRVVDSKVGDEVVLMNLDQLDYYAMNPVAARVWDIIGDASRTREEICQKVLEEYDVDASTCDAAVERFLGEAVDRGFLTTQ